MAARTSQRIATEAVTDRNRRRRRSKAAQGAPKCAVRLASCCPRQPFWPARSMKGWR